MTPQFAESTAICIAGMHRSGTSMVTRLLRELGLHLGPEEDLAPATPDNLDGHWENAPLSRINDALLSARGGGWDLGEPVTPEQIGDLATSALRAQAEATLLPFRRERRWGWKDPRNSLTLPFWREVVPDLKVVICLRNPLEVALSLRKRNFFSWQHSLALWTTYYEHLLKTTPPEERLITHYDAFFHEPVEELRRVAAFAGLSSDDRDLAAITEFIRPDLRHNRFTLSHLVATSVSPGLFALYLQLCHEGSWLDGNVGVRAPSEAELAELSRWMDAASIHTAVAKGRAVGQIDEVALERELLTRDFEGVRRDLERRDSRISVLENEVSTRDHQLRSERERTSSEIEKRENRISDLEERVSSVQSELHAADAAIAEQKQQIRNLLSERTELKANLDGAHTALSACERELSQLFRAHESSVNTSREAITRLSSDLEKIHGSRLWRFGEIYWNTLRRLRAAARWPRPGRADDRP